MILGLLIGLAIWGLFTNLAHGTANYTIEQQRVIANTDPRVLNSIRINGLFRLIGNLAFLLGTCGAIGWCVEVFL